MNLARPRATIVDVGIRDENALGSIGALVAGCPRVCAAWVFGSVARGEATAASDLDLAVLLDGASTAGDDEALRLRGQLVRVGNRVVLDLVTAKRADMSIPGHFFLGC